MSYQEFLSFERRGAVGIVRLARPEKLNTISAPFYEAMIELQQTEIVGDHDLRAIALLADGRHFSAGIDLNYAKAVIGKPGRSLYGVYHWQQAYRFWSECNLPVVVGIQGACMGTAIELITAEMPEETPRMTALRDKLIRGILDAIPESRLNGHPTQRLPGNVNISVRYIEGESLLLSLDMAGIAASSGSACTSGSLDPSHVLLAIGLPHEIAHGSLRFSLGRETTEEQIDYVLEQLPKIVERLRAMSPLYADRDLK